MILTTTNTIEGFKIMEYKGIVSGISVNVQKLKMTFNMEKYYKAIAESMGLVKEQAFQQLQDNARNLKANAIVGIKVDIELTTSNYVTVSVTGTAVLVA
ncbi:YbjQ family protein [Gelidibacter maritimus]|uniref:Heavy metal-binding domain-containing protein n=1 Tax=Gelidibacter maritimus TaxID=2761487 RepID=A0A7W2M3G8_9FLAO|nr:heavy metal-binding domain-containing protein [Gelidibacter maritimus]MBA6151965.1 heavy metal-binding domain-containing protein [Gelidibacter maritimus]